MTPLFFIKAPSSFGVAADASMALCLYVYFPMCDDGKSHMDLAA